MAFDSWGLLEVADSLISANDPSDSHIARAISTAYYAIFQHVCCAGAELLIGPEDDSMTRAKEHVRRSFGHKALCKRLGMAQNADHDFPENLVNFGTAFCQSRKKRESADYDVSKTFSKSDALDMLASVRCAMGGFDAVEEKHRRAFIVWALIDRRER